jgi:LacI family transcriptional regulator
MAVTAVISDDCDGGRNAAAHVVGLGHRSDIWIVGETPANKYVADGRRRGVEQRLASDGIQVAGTLDCNWWPESAYEAVNEALTDGWAPRALVCLNDRVALGAYQALKGAGWSIPNDVTVVSFDDSPMASWMQPKLTSVAMPYHHMATHAVELLLTGNDADGVHRIPMTLHVRGSSGPPRP